MKYKELSDEFLASLAQQNDADAMETLILRYRYLVTAIAHSYFLVDGDVEDLIQVGQIGVFKAITTYKGKAEFKYYVYKCVKNSVLSAIKKSTTNKNFALACSENMLMFSFFLLLLEEIRIFYLSDLYQQTINFRHSN